MHRHHRFALVINIEAVYTKMESLFPFDFSFGWITRAYRLWGDKEKFLFVYKKKKKNLASN